MKKSIKLFMAMLLIGGSALTFSSCKDSENVSDTPVTPEEIAQSKESEPAKALLSILSFTSQLDSLPDNWFTNNYTEEPTVGFVNDESTPHVRYLTVQNKEEAINKYISMTGKPISMDATSDTKNIEGVGSLNFQVQNQTDVIATLDLNIKQQPHLTQIRFVPVGASGNNFKLGGEPYYNFGDVVSIQEGNDVNKRTYWICVRPCSDIQEKRMSHWVSFQLNDYDSKEKEGVPSGSVNFSKLRKSRIDYYLPTKLGIQARSLEHTQNLFKLLNVLLNPTRYSDNTYDTYKDGIGGIGRNELSQTRVRMISNNWTKEGIWKKVLPPGIQYNTLGNIFDQDGKIYAFYYGYHSSSPSVYLATIKSDDLTLESSGELELTDVKENVDFREYYKRGVLKLDNLIKGLPQKGFIVRYKTGNLLVGNFSSMSNDEAPLESFSIKHSNIKDEYVLSKYKETSREGGSVMGDVIENDVSQEYYNRKPGEVCILNNGSKAPANWEEHSAYFQYAKEGTSYSYMQNKEIAISAYIHLLNACLFDHVTDCNEYLDIENEGSKKFDVSKLKFSEYYQIALENILPKLRATESGHCPTIPQEVVDFKIFDKNGNETKKANDVSTIEKAQLTFAFKDTETTYNHFNTAVLTYTVSTGEYKVSDVKHNVTTICGKGFYHLKGYPDFSDAPTLIDDQKFTKTITENRDKVRQASIDFLNSAKVK